MLAILGGKIISIGAIQKKNIYFLYFKKMTNVTGGRTCMNSSVSKHATNFSSSMSPMLQPITTSSSFFYTSLFFFFLDCFLAHLISLIFLLCTNVMSFAYLCSNFYFIFLPSCMSVCE